MDAYRKASEAVVSQRLDEARTFVEQAVAADPKNPHAHALAGDLAFLAHDLEGAVAAWRRALAVDARLRPVHERLRQVEQELRSASPVSGTPPTGYPGGGEPDTGALQAAQIFLERQLDMRFAGPIAVLALDPDLFHGGLHAPTEVAGLFDGKIRLPLRRQSDSHQGDSHFGRPGWPSLQAVIWHHAAHAAVHQLAKGRAPRWVHEGVAQLAQAHIEPIPTAALRIAHLGRKVPSLEQLESHGQEMGLVVPMEAGVFYQASWAQMAYLREQLGWKAIARFLTLIGEGVTAKDALARVTKQNPEIWQESWRVWLSERLAEMAPGP